MGLDSNSVDDNTTYFYLHWLLILVYLSVGTVWAMLVQRLPQNSS